MGSSGGGGAVTPPERVFDYPRPLIPSEISLDTINFFINASGVQPASKTTHNHRESILIGFLSIDSNVSAHQVPQAADLIAGLLVLPGSRLGDGTR
jgi:hypothetical protein